MAIGLLRNQAPSGVCALSVVERKMKPKMKGYDGGVRAQLLLSPQRLGTRSPYLLPFCLFTCGFPSEIHLGQFAYK